MGKATDAAARADRGFVLRTPLLPLEVFVEWQAAPDPRRYLAELVTRADVREALFVASPSLTEGIEKWRHDPDATANASVELSLGRYVARMAGRCTPFGLFSAVSAGELAGQTSLSVAPVSEYRRRTRIDNDYLFALISELSADAETRARLRYFPNSSFYEVGGRLRYAEARLAGKDRSYHLVAVDHTPYLDATLERCRQGAKLGDLAAALVADDAEVTLDEATAYVDELVTAQVIVPDLAIAVTGREPVDVVIDQLGRAELAEPVRVLAAARNGIEAIDGRGVGNDAAAYRTVAALLETLPAKVELSRLFQVDMVKPAAAQLGTQIATAVARTVEWLRPLQRTAQSTGLEAFSTAFAERYESRAVPLTEVLDEESGIGFEATSGPGSEGSPLLAGLHFGAAAGEERVGWGSVERHLQRRLADALAAADREIVLGDDDRKAMTVDPARRLPDAYSAQIRLQQHDQAAPTILFEGAFGPSGARMLGRFCHASQEIDTMVRAHLRAEEAHRPDAVFAEVVHLNEGRIGNIVCRPVLRDYEITFLGLSGAPLDRQITLDDLLVSVVGNRVVLTSRRLGREVIPRMTTAHNYRLRALGIYKFLCALQESGGGAMFTWGALGGAPYLPRVRIGDVVVARASWNVGASDLAPITAVVREMNNKKADKIPTADKRQRIAATVSALRDKLRLPRYLAIADGDNELSIDLDNAVLVQVFADELAGRTAVQLTEQFPIPGASPVRGPEGRFANQIVMTFVRPVGTEASATFKPRTASVTRSFAPGSTWLYAKVYCGFSTVDRVLREAAAPVVRETMAAGDASHWFFIRYADPQPHLRLRFAGDPARLAAAVLPRLHAALEPLRAAGAVWRVQLDTYEREIERYGGDRGIELAEQLFWIDSEAVLGIVELLEGDAGAEARWRLALRGCDSLLAAVGFDADTRHRIFADARDQMSREFRVGSEFFAPIGDRYKRERAALETLLSSDDPAFAEHDLAPGFELLATRDARLQPIAEQLRKRDAAGELAPTLRNIGWSLVHMHANRILHASQRAQELVLYDLLRRLHEARRARSKKA